MKTVVKLGAILGLMTLPAVAGTVLSLTGNLDPNNAGDMLVLDRKSVV